MSNRQTSRFQSKNNGGKRPNSHLIGNSVSVIQKHDQATGHLTSGTIAEILTNSSSHHRGIKVRLTDGTVGRISTATTTNGVSGSEFSFPINDHHDGNSNHRQSESHTISDYIMPRTVLPNHQKRTANANAVKMDTATAICSQLISEFEGLTLSSSASSRKSNTTTNACVPSLYQFYRLGLILYRISKQHLRNNSIGYKDSSRNNVGDLNTLRAYRKLIETIPRETLRLIFVDLRRATQTHLKSTLTIHNNDDDDHDNNTAIDDLGSAARSLAGLICSSFLCDDNNNINNNNSSSSNNSRASCHLCYIIYDKAWISTLSALYDRFVIVESRTSSSSSEIIKGTKNDLLSCLSQLLLDGLLLPRTDNFVDKVSMTTKMAEESLLEAIRAMEEESTDCLRDLQQWQVSYEPFRRSLETSILNIGNKHNNNHENDSDNYVERAQQREYILSMLESARGQSSSTAFPSSSAMMTNNKNNSTTRRAVVVPSSSSTSCIGGTKELSELDRRIQQVKQILPHFGEGFVEAALSLHRGDVEGTVATLLNHPADNSSSSNSSYPAALRVLDPNLPRRKREFQTYRSVEEEKASAEQARRDVKERMALEEKQQQERYEALVVVTSQQTVELQETEGSMISKKKQQQQLKNEYDDDYDDQYDEVDIKLGTTDDGFTMDNDGMTFEQIKLYNQILREDESDSSFWEGARNTNRQRDGGRRRDGDGGDGGGTNSRPSSRSNSPKKNGNHNNNSNNGEKKYRGPKKIKGGRAIGADGKIIRNPGGDNNNSNNRHNIDNNNDSSSSNNKSQAQPNKSNNNNNNNNKKTTKPRTKPKSDNRVSRQRDRKQAKQGAFGVQS
mmetsp:Transcript_22166/g.25370  ORF Transcript_22166/g.25370 Transcript_22166/m.25370 type:complete len:844 (+) Transcript_22166:177-2708(+)